VLCILFKVHVPRTLTLHLHTGKRGMLEGQHASTTAIRKSTIPCKDWKHMFHNDDLRVIIVLISAQGVHTDGARARMIHLFGHNSRNVWCLSCENTACRAVAAPFIMYAHSDLHLLFSLFTSTSVTGESTLYCLVHASNHFTQLTQNLQQLLHVLNISSHVPCRKKRQYLKLLQIARR
jgi:hypothetical protein